MKMSSRFGSMQALMPPLIGVLLLLNSLGKPRVESLHGTDVVGLVAAGFLLGIGFVGLMARLKPAMFASPTKDQS